MAGKSDSVATPKTILFTLVRESSYAQPLWKSDDGDSGHHTWSEFEVIAPTETKDMQGSHSGHGAHAQPQPSSSGVSPHAQPQPSSSMESPPVKTAPQPKKQRVDEAAQNAVVSQLRQQLAAALTTNTALCEELEELKSRRSPSHHSEVDSDPNGLEAEELGSVADSDWENSDNDHDVGERAPPEHVMYLRQERTPEALESAIARGLDIDAWCHLYTPHILHRLSRPQSQQGGVGQAVNKHAPSRPLQRAFFNPDYFSFLGSQTGGALGRGVAIGNNRWGIPKSSRGEVVTFNCTVDWVDLFLPWTFSVEGGPTEYEVTLTP